MKEVREQISRIPRMEPSSQRKEKNPEEGIKKKKIVGYSKT